MPLGLVTVGVATPVRTFVAVTLAPATTAPVGSVTVPVIDPVMVCVNAGIHITMTSANAERQWKPSFSPLCIAFLRSKFPNELLMPLRVLAVGFLWPVMLAARYRVAFNG
jgi:hypothetical protein